MCPRGWFTQPNFGETRSARIEEVLVFTAIMSMSNLHASKSVVCNCCRDIIEKKVSPEDAWEAWGCFQTMGRLRLNAKAGAEAPGARLAAAGASTQMVASSTGASTQTRHLGSCLDA